MNQTEADQLLPDLKKQNVFVKNNPYYSYYSKNSNKHPKSLYFSHSHKGPARREGCV